MRIPKSAIEVTDEMLINAALPEGKYEIRKWLGGDGYAIFDGEICVVARVLVTDGVLEFQSFNFAFGRDLADKFPEYK